MTPLQPRPGTIDDNIADISEYILLIITWIAGRGFEIWLFRQLQTSVNNLNSLTSQQLTYVATLLFRLLVLGTRHEDLVSSSRQNYVLNRSI